MAKYWTNILAIWSHCSKRTTNRYLSLFLTHTVGMVRLLSLSLSLSLSLPPTPILFLSHRDLPRLSLSFSYSLHHSSQWSTHVLIICHPFPLSLLTLKPFFFLSECTRGFSYTLPSCLSFSLIPSLCIPFASVVAVAAVVVLTQPLSQFPPHLIMQQGHREKAREGER